MNVKQTNTNFLTLYTYFCRSIYCDCVFVFIEIRHEYLKCVVVRCIDFAIHISFLNLANVSKVRIKYLMLYDVEKIAYSMRCGGSWFTFLPCHLTISHSHTLYIYIAKLHAHSTKEKRIHVYVVR